MAKADELSAIEALHRMRDGCLMFLDGFNEHGYHAIPSNPNFGGITYDDTREDHEAIITDALLLGFEIGDHVWVKFKWHYADYNPVGYWEYDSIDVGITKLVEMYYEQLALACA